MNIESIENGVKITIPKKENYTLEDLKQNLVILDYENKD